MKKEIADLWVAALRSGEYTQAKYKLRTKRDAEPDGFCCLGVLSDLYLNIADNPTAKWVPDLGGIVAFAADGQSDEGFLIDPVKNWAGLISDAGSMHAIPDTKLLGTHAAWKPMYSKLTVCNDNGISFADIADFIELYWEYL